MSSLLAWLFGGAILIFGMVQCENSDWNKAQRAADRAAEVARETPYIIRKSPDGCMVYAFQVTGVIHFFTRCATQTTTARNYTEACGKNCSHAKTEEITTENK